MSWPFNSGVDLVITPAPAYRSEFRDPKAQPNAHFNESVFRSVLEDFSARIEGNNTKQSLLIDDNAKSIAEIHDLVAGLKIQITQLMNNSVRLNEIKQTSSVIKYYEDFVSIISGMKLAEDYVLNCFIDGLEEEIQGIVRMYKPQTLHNAYYLAKLQEFTRRYKRDKIEVVDEKEVEVVEEVIAHKVFDEMPQRNFSENDSHKSPDLNRFNLENGSSNKEVVVVKQTENSEAIEGDIWLPFIITSEVACKVVEDVKQVESHEDTAKFELEYVEKQCMVDEVSLIKDKKTWRQSGVIDNYEWKPGLNFLLQENWRKKNHYHSNEATDLDMIEVFERDRSKVKENGTKNISGLTLAGDINVAGLVEMVSSYSAYGLHDLLFVQNNLFSESGNFNNIFQKQDLHSFDGNLELLVANKYDGEYLLLLHHSVQVIELGVFQFGSQFIQHLGTVASKEKIFFERQHVLQCDKSDKRFVVIRYLAGQIVKMSFHNLVSLVVEECFIYGKSKECLHFMNKMLGYIEEKRLMQAMMKDHYGNYVVQKVVETRGWDQSHELAYSHFPNSLFLGMQNANVETNDVTAIHVLSSCTSITNLTIGKLVHFDVGQNFFLTKALGNECGCIEKLTEIFEKMYWKHILSLTMFIQVMTSNRLRNGVLKHFDLMLAEHKRSHVTFSGISCASIDVGLDDNACALFSSLHYMRLHENISRKPRIKHHGCTAEILAQHGLLDNDLKNHLLSNTTRCIHVVDVGIYFVDFLQNQSKLQVVSIRSERVSISTYLPMMIKNRYETVERWLVKWKKKQHRRKSDF